jgi:hypothetical protein
MARRASAPQLPFPTNVERLVMISVIGEITSPLMRHPHSVGARGEPFLLPKYGGITYNVRVGDPAMGWEGDHVEPGVSIKNKRDAAENGALLQLACIGNDALVVSGDAKGQRGWVTGAHGGVDHVLVDFEPDVLDALVIGDRIQVRAWGQGLKFHSPALAPVRAMSCDPRLLARLLTVGNDVLRVPVVAEIDGFWMGSGIGVTPSESNDFDITTNDPAMLQRLREDIGLRLGDLILIRDYLCDFGFSPYRGARSIGVVVHCDSLYAGHGPGVRVILTVKQGELLQGVPDPDANIANIRSRQ